MFLPLIYSVKNHAAVKPMLLDFISKVPCDSVNKSGEKISRSDYHLNAKPDFPPYTSLAMQAVRDPLLRYLQCYNASADLDGIWFHQYESGDLFGWHHHGGASWSMIYYVELPMDGPKTEFMIPPFSSVFAADVKEGDVLIFPSQIQHRSTINYSRQRKTIISANFNMITNK